MAYTGSTLMGPVIPGRSHYPRRGRHRSDAGPDLGDDAGGHGGPDDVVAAVVLTADAVEGLDVDGMGRAHGRIQFGAAGNALRRGLHVLAIWRCHNFAVKTEQRPRLFSFA